MIQLSPQLLEAVNGALFIVCIGVVLFFARYIVGVWTSGARRTLRGWYDQVAGAIAIMTLVIGDALIRGPVWFMRHVANTGGDADQYASTAMVLITVGAILGIVGGVCIVRQFAPRRCEIIAPIALAVLAIAFGVGMAM